MQKNALKSIFQKISGYIKVTVTEEVFSMIIKKHCGA